MQVSSLLVIVAVLANFMQEARAQQRLDWTQAERAILRLDPASIEILPPSVRAELARRGCTVPQVHGGTRVTNVVSGPFTSSRQVDLAVLCSIRGSSLILVFQEGDAGNVHELSSSPDRDYLQIVVPDEIGFSREISVATPEEIRTYADVFGGEVPTALDRAGIDDAFSGKASVIWYWDDARWYRLQGSD